MISKEEDNPTSRIEELLNKISEPTELTSFTSEEQEILRALVKRPDYILYEIVKKTRIKITKNGLEIANNIKDDLSKLTIFKKLN